MVEEWRERVFGETMDDPVKVAVEEAVKDFGSAEDFAIWAWYANRMGRREAPLLAEDEKNRKNHFRPVKTGAGRMFRPSFPAVSVSRNRCFGDTKWGERSPRRQNERKTSR